MTEFYAIGLSNLRTIEPSNYRTLGLLRHYPMDLPNVVAVTSRVSCKCRAARDISQRPSQIILTALQSTVVTSADDQVTSRNVVINRVRKQPMQLSHSIPI